VSVRYSKLGISSSLIDHAVVSLDFVQSGSYETGTAYGASRRGKEEDLVQDQIKQKNKETTGVIHDDIASTYSLLEKKSQ